MTQTPLVSPTTTVGPHTVTDFLWPWGLLVVASAGAVWLLLANRGLPPKLRILLLALTGAVGLGSLALIVAYLADGRPLAWAGQATSHSTVIVFSSPGKPPEQLGGPDQARLVLHAEPAGGDGHTVRLIADIVGGPDDNRDLYCQSLRLQSGDGRGYAQFPDCLDWTPEVSIPRRFEQTHTYSQPGSYEVVLETGPLKTSITVEIPLSRPVQPFNYPAPTPIGADIDRPVGVGGVASATVIGLLTRRRRERGATSGEAFSR